MACFGKIFCYNIIGVVYDTHCGYGIHTQVRAYKQRLRVGIRYTAYAACAVKILQLPFKFCSERGVFDAVNFLFKAFLPAVHHHAATACAQM